MESQKEKKGIKMQRQEFSINDERQCSHTGLKNPSKVKKKKKSEKQLKGEKDTLSSEKQQTESWPLSSDGS